MNKTVVIIILVVLLGFALYYLFGRERSVSTEIEETDTEENIETDEVSEEGDEASDEDRASEVRGYLGSATVNIPDLDTVVELEDGEASFDAGAGADGYLTLGDTFAFVRDEGAEFALVHATMSTGGSGTFDYVLAFKVEGEELTHTGSGYLGDRIIVEGIDVTEAAGGSADVSVDILTRLDDEPLSALPTVPETLEFTLNTNGELEG